jgi:hypothetical protein
VAKELEDAANAVKSAKTEEELAQASARLHPGLFSR